ncbi:MAG TPA: serine protease [Sphingobacteriaceae bacterium]|nr:serine protease [Sphingobacteriaceae bacterium]
MKSEIELINQIEAYLRRELSPEEKSSFEKLRAQDPAMDTKVVAHLQLMKQIAEYGEHNRLKADMKNIHSQLDVDSLKEDILPYESRMLALWTRYRVNASIAACVAILATFFTMLSTGYITKSSTDPNYNYLNRKVNNLARSQQQINQKINNNTAPSKLGVFAATGFALSTDGYIITNYHVVKDADSVYIQNTDGESFKVKTVYTDPVYDIAILLITDKSFKPFNSLPYSIKKSPSDVGEGVYTIGFPRDVPVYNEGYLSAQTGYRDGMSDTTTYQVAIPVNPGNSGGPLMDNKGNIIGIVSAKQTLVDGATFAIKSKYLLKSIQITRDSLDQKLILSKKNSLAGLSRREQFKKMQDYIFIVKTY